MTKRRSNWLASRAALAFVAAALPAGAAEPTVDEMVEALAPKPAAPLTRSLRPGEKKPLPKEGRLQLSVQFEYASARITPESRQLLLRLASAMKADALSSLAFRIEGHTDSTGGGLANLRLSERRAKAVVDFLHGQAGIDAARLNALGMGSAMPADPADPTAAVNRRVVIVSLEPSPAAAPDKPATASAKSAADAGTVEQVKGELQVLRGRSNIVLQSGARVREGDLLTTAANASALLRFDDGAKLLLRADSVLRVVRLKLTGDPSAWSQAFDLAVGAFRYVTGALGGNRPEAVAFTTANATVGIRGTDLDVVFAKQGEGVPESGTYVKVNKGAVALGGVDGSSVALAKDEQAYAGPRKPVTRGMAPVPAAVRLKEKAAVFSTGEMDELLEAR